jgi:hypothetical protein
MSKVRRYASSNDTRGLRTAGARRSPTRAASVLGFVLSDDDKWNFKRGLKFLAGLDPAIGPAPPWNWV